jgi:hypothetical protein
MTRKDKKILHAMVERYGPEKGKRVFYASATAGKLGRDVKQRHGSRKEQR